MHFFLQEEIKGLSNVEKVLLDTADSVMDTKKKLEFGVQQIIFKVRVFFLLNQISCKSKSKEMTIVVHTYILIGVLSELFNIIVN